VAYRVAWTTPALRDLESIIAYISKDSRQYASQFAREALEVGDSLSRFPRRGRRVPEFAHVRLWEIFLANYRLVYAIGDEKVEIIALIHGARNLWLAWGSR
jgi:toxin ParE1/3/4